MSTSSSSGASDNAEWIDVEPDEEIVSYTSLFGAETFTSLGELLEHCKEQHGFDLAENIRRLHLDFHGAVKLVNFVRSCVAENKTLPEPISANDFADERYLKPTLDNDALIFSLDEILENDLETGHPKNSGQEETCQTTLTARNKALESELAAVKEHFANYRLAVEETLDRRWGDDNELSSQRPKRQETSDYYFESYSFNEIHETMLKDEVRTDGYRDFIYENKPLFKGKTVLDIGCGTGILSMFCAKAGAAKVIAVDKSDIIDKARENIYNNGLSDTVTCLRGAIEDVKLPVDEVDIIVSEWMGYCLLYEAMLPSVLYARDKYLKPDGLLVPSSATIWIAPVEDPTYVSDSISFWRDVYGFDMKAMQEGIYEEARILNMPKSSICGEPFPFKVLDLHTVSAKDLAFTSEWKSRIMRQVDGVDGFLIWFDNFFATSRSDPIPSAETTPEDFTKKRAGYVAFTTGPFGKETHWKQGLLLQPSVPLKADSQLPTISGQVTFSALQENSRALGIEVSWSESEISQHVNKRNWKLK